MKLMKKIACLIMGLLVIAMPEMAQARRRGGRYHGGRRGYRRGYGRRGYGRRYGYGGYYGSSPFFSIGLGTGSSFGWGAWPGYWDRRIYSNVQRDDWRTIRNRLNNEIDDLQDQIDDLQVKLDRAESKSDTSKYQKDIAALQDKVDKYEADLEAAKARQ
jgi:hypothetical protein